MCGPVGQQPKPEQVVLVEFEAEHLKPANPPFLQGTLELLVGVILSRIHF